MFGLQPIHIVLIVLAAVLIFGPKKLPEFGKGLGKSIREFRQASNGVADDLKSTVDMQEEAAVRGEAPSEPA